MLELRLLAQASTNIHFWHLLVPFYESTHSFPGARKLIEPVLEVRL
jgi:hypothetical protein